MKTVLIYYWWGNGVTRVWEDLNNPVVVAIALVRAFDKELPIHVIDASEADDKDWGGFPDRLNFTVSRANKSYPLPPRPSVFPTAQMLFHQTWDVYDYALDSGFEVAIFADMDIFWRKPVLPLGVASGERFVCDTENTGLYYFRVGSGKVRQFYDLWKSRILLGATSPEYRDKVTSNYVHPLYQEESVYRYMLKTEPDINDLVEFYPRNENFFVYDKESPVDPTAKNFHFIRHFNGEQRAMYAYYIKDFYESISSVLSPEEMKMIFKRPSLKPGSVRFKDITSLWNVEKQKTLFFLTKKSLLRRE